MDLGLYLAFIAATVLLALLPGPNMALIVSNSIAHGTRFGFLTLLGTSLAMAIQLACVAIGMTAALAGLGHWFALLRWVGAVYLIVLGVRLWRTPAPTLTVAANPRSAAATVLRGALVSLTNPKVLLFFGALFPQFISRAHPLVPQLAVMSVTFLAVAAALDSVWATLAGRARGWIVARGRLLNRISGGLLAGAGVGLAASR